MTMRRRFHLGSDTSGAAAAEMALILPLVLTMMFATFEGAWYLVCEHRVIKGVRDAARYAARLDRAQFTCPGNRFKFKAVKVLNVACKAAENHANYWFYVGIIFNCRATFCKY